MHEAARRRYVAELAEGNARSARALDCPRCGRPVIAGECDDDISTRVTVDADPLDRVGEMLAVLDGREVFTLEKQYGPGAGKDVNCLWWRHSFAIHSPRPPRGTVHAMHLCPAKRAPMQLCLPT